MRQKTGDELTEMIDASLAVNFSNSAEESDDTEHTAMDAEIIEITKIQPDVPSLCHL